MKFIVNIMAKNYRNRGIANNNVKLEMNKNSPELDVNFSEINVIIKKF